MRMKQDITNLKFSLYMFDIMHDWGLSLDSGSCQESTTCKLMALSITAWPATEKCAIVSDQQSVFKKHLLNKAFYTGERGGRWGVHAGEL